MSKRKLTTSDFIAKAIAVHDDKYSYEKLIYTGADSHVVIKCNTCNEDFKKLAKCFLKGYGCMNCHAKPKGGKFMTTELFIEKAKSFHGDRYDYSLTVYVRNDAKVIIICKTHGNFEQRANSHVRGQGCPACAVADRTMTKFDFVKTAQNVHGDLFNYDECVYNGAFHSVSIGCKIHGIFQQSASNHLAGAGCALCSRAKVDQDKVLSTAQFVEKSKAIWGEKYDYSLTEYTGMRKKLTIKCPDHGTFTSVARNHVSGHTSCSGCQQRGYSQKAIRWLNKEADKRHIFIQHAENIGEYKIEGTPFAVDGYHAETKTVFEYCGNYFHGNPEIYPRDFVNTLCNKTMGDLYDKTIKRLNIIRDLGYQIVVKWEDKTD